MTTSTSSTDFGRVENDGTVLVKMPDGSEKQVGQWAAGDPNDGLTFFIRKFDEIENEISLTLQILPLNLGVLGFPSNPSALIPLFIKCLT